MSTLAVNRLAVILNPTPYSFASYVDAWVVRLVQPALERFNTGMVCRDDELRLRLIDRAYEVEKLVGFELSEPRLVNFLDGDGGLPALLRIAANEVWQGGVVILGVRVVLVIK